MSMVKDTAKWLGWRLAVYLTVPVLAMAAYAIYVAATGHHPIG